LKPHPHRKSDNVSELQKRATYINLFPLLFPVLASNAILNSWRPC
jgi:hypothetical protein